LVICMLLSASICRYTCSPRRSSVLGWLRDIDSRSVLSYPYARGPFRRCQASWLRGGTCCDERTLESTEETVSTMRDDAVARFSSVLEESLKNLSRSVSRCKQSSTVSSAILNKAQETNGKCLVGLSPEAALKAIEFAHNLTKPKHLGAYIQEYRKCFQKELEIRNEGICDGCSAESRRSFRWGWGQKLEITPEMCVDLLSSCFSTWKFIFDTTVMRYFDDIAESGIVNESTLEDYEGSDLQKLIEAFEACPEGFSTLTCHTHHLQTICDAYTHRLFPGSHKRSFKLWYIRFFRGIKNIFSKLLKKWKKRKNGEGEGEGEGEENPPPAPEPGTGNTDQGTVCGCPVCDDFNFDYDTYDYYSRTVTSTNLECTVIESYSDHFASTEYIFTTYYANNQPLYSSQTVQCIPQAQDETTWITPISLSPNPNQSIVSSQFNVDTATCVTFASFVRDTDNGDGTVLRETFTFDYDPRASPFTGRESFPTEQVTAQTIQN